MRHKSVKIANELVQIVFYFLISKILITKSEYYRISNLSKSSLPVLKNDKFD